MQESAVVGKVREVAAPIIDDLGLELVDLEFKREGGGWVLRLFIDKLDGGVSLDDCVDVSRELGTALEVEDPIPASYRLEVSSPGLDRPLKKLSDYDRFRGERVKIKTFDKLDPDGRGYERKTFVGKLLGLEGDSVRLLQLDKKGGEISFAFEQIAAANLDPQF